MGKYKIGKFALRELSKNLKKRKKLLKKIDYLC